jgi:hypothetical protein
MGQRFMNWDSWVSETFMSNYVKLRPHTDVAALEKKLGPFEQRLAGQELKKWNTHETALFTADYQNCPYDCGA